MKNYKIINNFLKEENFFYFYLGNNTQMTFCLLHEGKIIKGLKNVINYIKSIFLELLYSRGILSKREDKLDDIKIAYNQLMQDYSNYKQDPEGNQELVSDLIDRARELKGDIEEYKSIPEIDTPLSQGDGDYEEVETSSDTLMNNTSTTSTGGSVGDVTSYLDTSSNKVWSDCWEKNCKGKLSGKELKQCKARCVDIAVRYFQKKIYLCRNTEDPQGCLNTLKNLLDVWKQRKLEYLRSR